MVQRFQTPPNTRRSSFQATRRTSPQIMKRPGYRARVPSSLSSSVRILFHGEVHSIARWVWDKEEKVLWKLKPLYRLYCALESPSQSDSRKRKVYRYSRNVKLPFVRGGHPRWNPVVHQAVRVDDRFYEGCKVWETYTDEEGNENTGWILQHLVTDGEGDKPWGRRVDGVWEDRDKLSKVFIGYTNTSDKGLHNICKRLDMGYNFHDGEKLDEEELLLRGEDPVKSKGLDYVPGPREVKYNFFDKNCNHFVKDLLEQCVAIYVRPWRKARSDRAKSMLPNWLGKAFSKFYDKGGVNTLSRKWSKLRPEKEERDWCHVCRNEKRRRSWCGGEPSSSGDDSIDEHSANDDGRNDSEESESCSDCDSDSSSLR